MWITFKICIFVIANNSLYNQDAWCWVVNYFQNLYLCDLQQQNLTAYAWEEGCELLSKFVSLWFPTTIMQLLIHGNMLWITFKICIFVISNNQYKAFKAKWAVVNYFQNLYLCDLQQHPLRSSLRNNSCELLSKFVPLWLRTIWPPSQIFSP